MLAAVSGVAILMGLNLLGALPLRLPSLDMDVRQLSVPPLLQARSLFAEQAAVLRKQRCTLHNALLQDSGSLEPQYARRWYQWA